MNVDASLAFEDLMRVLLRMSRRSQGFTWCLLFLVLVVVGANGCNKSPGVVAVHGHISYRGNPLTTSAVTFFPTSGGRPVTAAAPKGEYTADLVPGDYTAVVNVGVEYPAGFKEGDPEPPPKVVLPPEYSTRAQSTLKTTVKAGQSDPIDFELK
jgi:hypothetical protein